MAMPSLQEQFGPIDIYLFDQLLRGNISRGMRILDAGCGFGRNLMYLLREGYEVFGADANPDAIAETRRIASSLAPTLPASNFRHEPIEAMSFPDSAFDVVLCSAVLHFAHSDEHFKAMLHGAWKPLKPGGLFFCRLASTIGMEHQHIEGRRFLLSNGAQWYLVDEEFLDKLAKELGGQLVDPLKTTVVQNQRCMTTWVLQKQA